MDSFYDELLSEIEKKRFSKTSARDVQASVRSFINWLWEIEILKERPRNLSSKSHRILVEARKIESFTVNQIRDIIVKSNDQLQLYVLLALNCGMTQIDISDCRPAEVDLERKTLVRKRGKTKQFDSVPNVTYPLWPETLSLLMNFRSENHDRILLAPGGGPLKSEFSRDGKVAKNDYIGLTFRRMLKKNDLTGNFKMLKKASATLLRDHPSYSGLESLFLDHAPRSMSDKHYAQVPTALLAEAVNWLRQQYQLEKYLSQKPKRHRIK